MEDIHNVRRDYTRFQIDSASVNKNPFAQFKEWFEAIQASEAPDPTAISISTVSHDGQPVTRMVLLKDYDEKSFTFFTNYSSQKGHHLSNNNKVCLLIFDPYNERQIQILGTATRLSHDASTRYFKSRPRDSQLGAWASNQSTVISDRQSLIDAFDHYQEKFSDSDIERPEDWGGYVITPHHFEFWQGRKNRLHDRIRFVLENNSWQISRLAP